MAPPPLFSPYDGSLAFPPSSQQTDSTKEASRSLGSRRLLACDANFVERCISYHVYPPGYIHPNGKGSPKPNNIEEISANLLEPAAPLVSQETHSEFLKKTEAISKRKLLSEIIPLIACSEGIPDIWYECSIRFGNIISITGNTTVKPCPDFFDGAYSQSPNKIVRDDLDEIIRPSQRTSVPTAPNFFLEADTRNTKVTERRGVLDGAYGARLMHVLQNYRTGKQYVYDDKAYTFTAILIMDIKCLNVKLYAHHVRAPTQPRGRPHYYATLLKEYFLFDRESYSNCIAALRNIRKEAGKYRERFIADANERATYAQLKEVQQGEGLGFMPFHEQDDKEEDTKGTQSKGRDD